MAPQQVFRVAPPQQPPEAVAPPVVPPQKELPEALKQTTVMVDNTGVAVPMSIASQVQKQPSLPIRPSEVAPAPTNQVMSHVGPIPAPVPAKAVPIPKEEVTETTPSEAESNSAAEVTSEPVSKASTEASSSVSKESSDSTPVSSEKTDSKPKKDIEPSKEDTSKKEEPETEKLPAQEVSNVDKVDETAKQKVEKKSLPQEKTEENTSSVTPGAAPPKEPSVDTKQREYWITLFMQINPKIFTGVVGKVQKNLPKEGREGREKSVRRVPAGGSNPGPTRVPSGTPWEKFRQVSLSVAIDRVGQLRNTTCRVFWRKSL